MSKRKILIVEDDWIVAEDTQNRLKNLGFDVTAVVSSGKEGIKKAKEDKPDLVLMDIVLKGEMDGIEAAEEIRTQLNIPIVYASAYADRQVVERAKITQPFGYIIKPFEDRELNTAIEIALYKHKMENKLKERKNWLSTTLNSIGDAVITTDTEGDVTFMNPVAQTLTGCDEAAAIGKPLEDVFIIINEETREKAENPVTKVLCEGRVIGLANHALLIAKDGTEIPIGDSGSPIIDEKGEITGVVLVFRDVREKKQSEEALQKSEEKYRNILENIEEGYYEVDLAGNFTFFNDAMCKIRGIPRDELMGINNRRYMTTETAKEVYKTFNKVYVTGESAKKIEWETIRPDGSKRYEETSASIMKDSKGQSIGFRGIVRDVTESKRAEKEKARLEAQLQQAQKMESIGTLAGGIAHDFNNILSPIMIHTQMVMADLPSDSSLQSNLKEIFQAGDRARDLVRQILTFSRQKQQEPIAFKIGAVVKEVLKLMRASLPATIEIRQNIEAKSDTVLADPTQVNQILMNICTNAAHALREEGGLLEVSLVDEHLDSEAANQFTDLAPGSYLRLTVSDTGHGIDPEIMDRIFEPYYTTKGVGEGTGMGLAVVHGIVKGYGGEITVESELGQGTTFHVLFPKIETEITTETEDQVQLPKGTESILFVDDEKAAVNAVKPMLEKLGYRVTARTSSVETLEAFRNNPDAFDMIITDMTMPNMTGAELAKEIMKLRADIPIILCTGFSEQIDEKKAMQMGIRAYVMKPIVMSAIAKTIREGLGDPRD